MTVTSVILVHDSSSLQHVLAVAHVDLLQTDERAGGQSSEEPVQGAPTLREQQFFQQFHRFICDLSIGETQSLSVSSDPPVNSVFPKPTQFFPDLIIY